MTDPTEQSRTPTLGRRKRCPSDRPKPAQGAQPAPERDLLQDSLAYAIKRTQVRCDEALMHYLDEGISPARLSALSTAGANPGISQAALGALLNIAGPSVVKVVDELERMELLRRDPSTDRRVYALRLTEKGTAALRRYHAAVAKFEAQISSDLTKAEREQLLALLRKVAPSEA
jgi:DNA-binding MarR family transcriptional regulator